MSNTKEPLNSNQISRKAPVLTYVTILLVFLALCNLFLPMYSSQLLYCVLSPFILLMAMQQNVSFGFIVALGGIITAILQSIILGNPRYIFGAFLLGITVWATAFLLSRWIVRTLMPLPKRPNRFFKDEKKQMKVNHYDSKDISAEDLLMDRAHIGYYLTLDTVVAPGMSTRRGYTSFGGGAECAAPPETIMTFPTFIPQIPCQVQ